MMIVEGLTYHKRLSQRVLCPEFDVDLVVVLLDTHWQVHNGLGQEDLIVIPPPGTPQIYPGHTGSTSHGNHRKFHDR